MCYHNVTPVVTPLKQTLVVVTLILILLKYHAEFLAQNLGMQQTDLIITWTPFLGLN
jgi:hypothetical protein